MYCITSITYFLHIKGAPLPTLWIACRVHFWPLCFILQCWAITFHRNHFRLCWKGGPNNTPTWAEFHFSTSTCLLQNKKHWQLYYLGLNCTFEQRNIIIEYWCPKPGQQMGLIYSTWTNHSYKLHSVQTLCSIYVSY